jgi:hypothetical protein
MSEMGPEIVNCENQEINDHARKAEREQQEIDNYARKVEREQQEIDNYARKVEREQQEIDNYARKVERENQEINDYARKVEREQQEISQWADDLRKSGTTPDEYLEKKRAEYAALGNEMGNPSDFVQQNTKEGVSDVPKPDVMPPGVEALSAVGPKQVESAPPVDGPPIEEQTPKEEVVPVPDIQQLDAITTQTRINENTPQDVGMSKTEKTDSHLDQQVEASTPAETPKKEGQEAVKTDAPTPKLEKLDGLVSSPTTKETPPGEQKETQTDAVVPDLKTLEALAPQPVGKEAVTDTSKKSEQETVQTEAPAPRPEKLEALASPQSVKETPKKDEKESPEKGVSQSGSEKKDVMPPRQDRIESDTSKTISEGKPETPGSTNESSGQQELGANEIRNVIQKTIDSANDIRDETSKEARKNLYERTAIGTLAEQLCYESTGAQSLNEIVANFPWADGVLPTELQQVKSHINTSVKSALTAYSTDLSKALGVNEDSKIDKAVDTFWDLRDTPQWNEISANLPPEVVNASDKGALKQAMLDKIVLRIPEEDVSRVRDHIRQKALEKPESYGLSNPTQADIEKLVQKIQPIALNINNHGLRIMAKDVYQQKWQATSGIPLRSHGKAQ